MGRAFSKMAELHRRQGGAQVHPEEGLEQPLLEHATETPILTSDEVLPPSALAPRPRTFTEQHELPWPLSAVAHALSAAWRYVFGLLRRLLLASRQVVPLSPVQQERLAELRQRAAATYDADAADQQEDLQELWTAAFPGSTAPPALKHEQWKDLGFQSDVPARDLTRGLGAITIQSLLWMARERPASFVLLARKQAGLRSEWEYPFAAGGMNIASLLVDLVGLQTSRAGAAGVPIKNTFLVLLEKHEDAFERLFELAYRLLDAIWLEQGASYMQFPLVMREVRARVGRALASGNAETFVHVQQQLLAGS